MYYFFVFIYLSFFDVFTFVEQMLQLRFNTLCNNIFSYFRKTNKYFKKDMAFRERRVLDQ